jgi:hypothetical protein
MRVVTENKPSYCREKNGSIFADGKFVFSKTTLSSRFLRCLHQMFMINKSAPSSTNDVSLRFSSQWGHRVSSKQTFFCFGSNRNKPELDLFRFCFGKFRITKKRIYLFVSVFRNRFKTERNKKSLFRNKPKPKKNTLLCNGHGRGHVHGHGHFSFVSVMSKRRNKLFRYRSETSETNVLFRIVPKLVSVPFSVISKLK